MRRHVQIIYEALSVIEEKIEGKKLLFIQQNIMKHLKLMN